MLIILYLFIVNTLVPKMVAYAQIFFEPIMVTIIVVSGIIMLFGAAGMRISNNLGSTIIGGIFMAIGYIVRMLVRAVSWIILNILRLIPRFFYESRRTFSQMGANNLLSNIFAVLTTIIVIAIIL